MIEENEAAKLLWEEFKYCHEQYWNAVYKFGFMIIVINIIPYIKPDVITHLRPYAIYLPIVAILLTILCTWILGARYQRLSMIKSKYDSLLVPNYLPDRMPRNNILEKILTFRMGLLVYISFGGGMLVISILNLVLMTVLGVPSPITTPNQAIQPPR